MTKKQLLIIKQKWPLKTQNKALKTNDAPHLMFTPKLD
ncbi:hypothetical protein X559_2231 [Paenilisteria newyorkensis]|nr:hypothetical protein X559_2231 [Listeria newyorkensis]